MSDAVSRLEAVADELVVMVPILPKVDRLREAGLHDGAVLILPPHVLVGLVRLYGLPIVRLDVPEPMIGLPGEPLPHHH